MEYNEFKSSFPKAKQKLITEDVFGSIDSEEMDKEQFFDNLVSMTDSINGKKNTIEQYINAVKFVSRYMVPGSTKVSAFRQTFPEKVAGYNTDSTLTSSATLYFQTKLVQAIVKQMMIQDHLFYSAERHKAYGVFLRIMDDQSAKEQDQIMAADKFLVHLKASEPKEINLDLGITGTNEAADLLADRLKAIGNSIEEKIQRDEITLVEVIE